MSEKEQLRLELARLEYHFDNLAWRIDQACIRRDQLAKKIEDLRATVVMFGTLETTEAELKAFPTFIELIETNFEPGARS